MIVWAGVVTGILLCVVVAKVVARWWLIRSWRLIERAITSG